MPKQTEERIIDLPFNPAARRAAGGGSSGGGGGATSFLGLTDTPSGYAGKVLFYVRVNAAGTGLEFVEVTPGGVDSVNGQTGVVVLDADDIDDTATTHKFTTADEISKLAGIEASADVTDAANVGAAIHGASSKTTPIDADTMPLIDSADSNALKKVTWSNIKATLKTYMDTLYTAINTAVLLTGAQSIAGIKTFSDGISFGNETLATYDEVPLNTTWEPVVTGSASNPTVSYSIQEATYTRIGNVVFYSLVVAFSSFSGGSGDVRISLPLTVSSILTPGVCSPSGLDLPGTSANVVFSAITGTAYGVLQVAQDNAVPQTVQISGLAATDSIRAAGFYFV